MNSTAISFIVLLVCGVASVFLQQKSEELRVRDRSNDLGKAYLERSRLPTAGFDAIMADLLWMRTNLRRGPQNSKDQSRELNEEMAKRLANRDFVGYLNVVKLDPTFRKAYHFAILRVMTELPDQAISMSELAMAFCKKDEKRFAELAGHIASKVKNVDERDYKDALRFYEVSVRGGPDKPYMGRQYLRTLARVDKLDPHTRDLKEIVKIIKIYHGAHMALLKSQMDVNAKNAGGQHNHGQGMPVMATVGAQRNPNDSWVRPTLIHTIRSFLGRVNQEKNDVEKKHIEEVKKIFDSLTPPKHLCSKCYRGIGPGDHFCSYCGEKAKVYGVCPAFDCQNVLKGPFCNKCGRKAMGKTAL